MNSWDLLENALIPFVDYAFNQIFSLHKSCFITRKFFYTSSLSLQTVYSLVWAGEYIAQFSQGSATRNPQKSMITERTKKERTNLTSSLAHKTCGLLTRLFNGNTVEMSLGKAFAVGKHFQVKVKPRREVSVCIHTLIHNTYILCIW